MDISSTAVNKHTHVCQKMMCQIGHGKLTIFNNDVLTLLFSFSHRCIAPFRPLNKDSLYVTYVNKTEDRIKQ